VVVREIELDHLILETDAPYLAPVPYRGKRNESSYILHVVQKLADIKETDAATAASITTANAKNLFGL
jgi:TatD DNase family protein